jgi:DMSO/TMAO reductase YedYZ molybdopterin-dependent catalytic subunit
MRWFVVLCILSAVGTAAVALRGFGVVNWSWGWALAPWIVMVVLTVVVGFGAWSRSGPDRRGAAPGARRPAAAQDLDAPEDERPQTDRRSSGS